MTIPEVCYRDGDSLKEGEADRDEEEVANPHLTLEANSHLVLGFS